MVITGIEATKKDGNKVAVMINPSNLVVEELNLEDKKRNEKLTKNHDKVRKNG